MTKTISRYQTTQSKTTGKRLYEYFEVLSTHVLNATFAGTGPYVAWYKVNKKRLIEGATLRALEFVPNFDPKKGVPFNYFVTIQINYLRAELKKFKKEQALKKQFGVLK
jgi:hypothetical protein